MAVVKIQTNKNIGLVHIRGFIYVARKRRRLVPQCFQEMQEFSHGSIVRRIESTMRSTWPIIYKEKRICMMHARHAKEPCPLYVISNIHEFNPLQLRSIRAQHSDIMAPLRRTPTKKLLIVLYRLQGITQDTTSFIRRMDQIVEAKLFVLLTYNVEVSYLSIDVDDATKTVHDTTDLMRHHYLFWTKILNLIMYNNNVTTNNRIYRQMIRIVTGTQVATLFADLYLYYKFKEVLNDPEIYLHEKFITDGFVLVSTEITQNEPLHHN